MNQNHSLELGAGFKGYDISLSEDTIDQNLYHKENKALALESYFQDRISLKNGLNLIPGIRIDAPGYLKKLLIQPRLSMNYELSPHLRIKAAWGKYDQYVVQSSVLDEAGNYRYFWTLSDGVDIPLQTANHLSAGVSYQTPKFSFGVESFFKRLNGLTRYVYLPNFMEKKIYIGDGISGGLDFLFEAKYKKHSAWIAYTLSKTVERFPYFTFSTYNRSPQDQRHEIKAALLLDFHPFYLSSNYVFGSGFPDRSILQFQRNTTNLVYSRWDISGVYKVSFKKFDLQAGLSILNLLNTENIKLQNLVKIPDLQGKAFNIMAEAVPFTPTLFLVIEF